MKRMIRIGSMVLLIAISGIVLVDVGELKITAQAPFNVGIFNRMIKDHTTKKYGSVAKFGLF